MTDNEKWMQRAILMAQTALKHKEVPVGCVVVWKNQDIIAEGCNEVNASLNATRHAEMVAIDQLVQYCQATSQSLEDVCSECVMYVTVEPCIMCSYALRLTNLTKVVFGCFNERFGGCGSVLNSHDMPLGGPMDHCDIPDRLITLGVIEFTAGVLKDEAVTLLQSFYKEENPNAPIDKVKHKKTH
jgi:tRNA-specific adenosine deaminase 2